MRVRIAGSLALLTVVHIGVGIASPKDPIGARKDALEATRNATRDRERPLLLELLKGDPPSEKPAELVDWARMAARASIAPERGDEKEIFDGLDHLAKKGALDGESLLLDLRNRVKSSAADGSITESEQHWILQDAGTILVRHDGTRHLVIEPDDTRPASKKLMYFDGYTRTHTVFRNAAKAGGWKVEIDPSVPDQALYLTAKKLPPDQVIEGLLRELGLEKKDGVIRKKP